MVRRIVAVRGAFLDLLQQLSCNGYSNHFGCLIDNAGHAYRANHVLYPHGIAIPRAASRLSNNFFFV